MIERLNRTIKDILSKYISVNQTDWDTFIDGIVFAYNSTIHESTGMTPYKMVFGEEMTLPVNLISENLDSDDIAVYKNEAEYVRYLEKCLCEMYEIVRSETKQSALRQKRLYDRNVRSINYEIGDLVRRSQPKFTAGCKNKVSTKMDRTLHIVKRLSDVLFQIRHCQHSKPVSCIPTISNRIEGINNTRREAIPNIQAPSCRGYPSRIAAQRPVDGDKPV